MSRYTSWKKKMETNPFANKAMCVKCKRFSIGRSAYFCGRSKLPAKAVVNQYMCCADYEPKEEDDG